MNSIMIDLCKTNINQLIKSNKNIDAHYQELILLILILLMNIYS